MLVEEARWLGRAVRDLPDAAFPLLNLGSSSMHFRMVSHPWVDAEIFAPLRASGREVIHVDLKGAPGVDMIRDFTRADVRREMAGLGVKSILCSNLLEHLEQDPEESAAQVIAMATSGTYLLVTVPRRYPYHADPIDNGYRPTPDQLISLFPGDVLQAEEVFCRRMAFYFAGFGTRWMRFALRIATPFIRPSNWRNMVRESPRLTSASCAVIRLEASQKGRGYQLDSVRNS